MKKLLWLCVALVFGTGLALSFDFSGLKPQGYVSDFTRSRVIDPASRAQLESYCARLKAATGVEVAVVTIDTLQGEPIEEVANDLFRRWGIGEKGKNEGLLLLLAAQDRRFRLEVGYGLEPIIPDGYAGSVLRSMRPALREGHYGEALEDAVQQIGTRIAQAKGVALEAGPRRHRHSRGQEYPIAILLFLGGLGILALLSSLIGRRGGGVYGGGGFFPGLILGGLLGRGLDFSRGGGGFGGFDSSDSFGGFGGGDSGGGGASSGW